MSGSTAYPARPAESSVPLLPVLGDRWSPSRFDPDTPVSERELRALLEAARWAPSSGNEQPAHWIAATPDAPTRAAVEAALKPGNAWAKRAPLLLVSVVRESWAKNGKPNAYAAHDAGIALGQLLAQATALGLATHPMAGFDREAMAEALGVPEGHTALTTVAVGRHDAALRDAALEEREARPRGRRALAEIAFRGRWGEGVTG